MCASGEKGWAMKNVPKHERKEVVQRALMSLRSGNPANVEGGLEFTLGEMTRPADEVIGEAMGALESVPQSVEGTEAGEHGGRRSAGLATSFVRLVRRNKLVVPHPADRAERMKEVGDGRKLTGNVLTCVRRLGDNRLIQGRCGIEVGQVGREGRRKRGQGGGRESLALGRRRRWADHGNNGEGRWVETRKGCRVRAHHRARRGRRRTAG